MLPPPILGAEMAVSLKYKLRVLRTLHQKCAGDASCIRELQRAMGYDDETYEGTNFHLWMALKELCEDGYVDNEQKAYRCPVRVTITEKGEELISSHSANFG